MGNNYRQLLMNVNPSLYAEIHLNRNIIDITTLTPNSHKKVWWKCSKDPSHYWEAQVDSRTRGYGCGMCRGLYVVHGVNDLSVTYPELYAELHPTMNTMDTTILSYGSNKKVWWKCSKNSSHYWITSANDRVQGNSCGMCAGQYVVHGVNDLSILNPSLYTELHPTMNIIDTTKLTPGSSKKVWWKCSTNPSHYWETEIGARTRGYGCAMCAGQYIVHGINDLSVSNSILYSELHPTMNTLDTTILSLNSHKSVWWRCSKNPSHYWKATVNDRIRGNCCGMCNSKYIVHGVNDLSVLNPDLYTELHPTMNTIDTKTLSFSSHKKVWWKCSKNPSHYWEAKVNNRANDNGCGMCNSKYIVHGINDLSVLNSGLYTELHPTMNTIDTTILSLSSHKKVWWKCSKCPSHCWQAKVSERNAGNGCPLCVTYRNESEFRDLFTEVTNLEFKDGHVIGERELFKRDKIQIDMINHEHRVIIEYDGFHSHGGNKLYKTSLEHCLAKDIDTTKTLLNAGYRVVRIRETPLQFLDLQHEGFFQVAFKDRNDKLPVVDAIVKVLCSMGIEIQVL